MKMFTDLLKKPSTYVLLFAGAVLAVAIPALARAAKPVADAIPGSKSKDVA